MIRAFVLTMTLLIFVSGCSSTPEDKPTNPEFESMVSGFLKEFWDVHPGYGAHVGLAQYDPILELPSQANRSKKLQFYKAWLSRFQKTQVDDLSFSQRLDRKLAMNELESSIWAIEDFKSFEWNPAIYNIGGSLSSVLEKQNRSLEDRLKDINTKLLQVPKYYDLAKANIKKPTREHVNLAIKQSQGLKNYLKNQIPKDVRRSKLSTREKRTLRQRLALARTSVNRYVSFLKKILSSPKKVGGFRSFRIGPQVYAKKFNYDLQIELTPDQLYKKALTTKQEIRAKMFEKAIELYPKYYGAKLPPKDRQKVIRQIITKVSKSHTTPKLFVETVRKQIPELTKFVRDKNLLTLDPSRPLKVRETPLFQRGFAGASVDSPGPYDKKRETYYNVTPLDGMTKKQKESYLREYNDYTLQILNIHEAIPGHYAQLVYSNQSPSLIKSLFSNGPMIEGWAVYTERMMLEQGYGENSPELWLMYYKWFLRVVTNTIIDYEIHNKELNKKQALKLMMEDAFQERAEAEGKWNRATVSQVQLASYFSGFAEIYALRENLKKKKGEDFNLKDFHEKFLSFGSAPVKEIKALML